jgi:hypothetical protein
VKRTFLVVVFTIGTAGCGNSSPSAPSAPVIAQVAGVWQMVGTLTGASGGECVGTLPQTVIGSQVRSTVSVTENGSSISANSTSQSNGFVSLIDSPPRGLVCQWAGTVGQSTFVMNLTGCQVAADDAFIITGFRCLNGALRDVVFFGSGVNGTVNGNTVTGTEVDTYNVYISGTRTAVGVGVLTLNSSFTMTQ